jgi:hypothetical protein
MRYDETRNGSEWRCRMVRKETRKKRHKTRNVAGQHTDAECGGTRYGRGMWRDSIRTRNAAGQDTDAQLKKKKKTRHERGGRDTDGERKTKEGETTSGKGRDKSQK